MIKPIEIIYLPFTPILLLHFSTCFDLFLICYQVIISVTIVCHIVCANKLLNDNINTCYFHNKLRFTYKNQGFQYFPETNTSFYFLQMFEKLLVNFGNASFELFIIKVFIVFNLFQVHLCSPSRFSLRNCLQKKQ